MPAGVGLKLRAAIRYGGLTFPYAAQAERHRFRAPARPFMPRAGQGPVVLSGDAALRAHGAPVLNGAGRAFADPLWPRPRAAFLTGIVSDQLPLVWTDAVSVVAMPASGPVRSPRR